MTWFDIVAILMIIVIAWLESIRGFGRALFDLIGALIVTKIAIMLSGALGAAAPVSQAAGPAQAFWMGIVFVVLAVLVVIAAKYVYESTLLSLDVLDPVVGAIFGIFSGMLVAHIFLRMLEVAYAETDLANVVVNSFMGQELLRLRSYHAVVNALQNISNW